MRGDGPAMILSVSTLAVIACQGCESGAGQHYYAPAQEREAPAKATDAAVPAYTGRALPDTRLAEPASVPSLSTDTNFSMFQSQTTTTPSISITPVLGSDSIDADLKIRPDFSGLRMSNSNAVTDFEGARKSANLVMPVRTIREFDASFALSAGDAQTGLGFDVGVVPRVSVRRDGDFRTRRFGGEIRIGQNFDQRGANVDAKSWYLFAGADGEALVYEPYRERSWSNSMALRDQVTVGDMQAGVSFTQGGGQLSVSYIRREVSYSERGVRGEESEDFAGVSFTLRR